MTVWTYIGQIVNFLVFVLILYLLLYKPVRRVMQRRKEEMEAELREAQQKLREAEQVRSDAERRAREIEDGRDSILKDAREQAEAQRAEMLQRVEEQARQRLERFRRIMEQERDELLDRIAGDLRDTIVKVARSVLSDASEGLADRGIGRVEKLLEDISGDELESARKAVNELENRVEVRSAGALSDEQLERLKDSIGRKLGIEEIRLEVKEDPSLLAGIEVTVGHINLEAHWRGMIDEALREQQEGT